MTRLLTLLLLTTTINTFAHSMGKGITYYNPINTNKECISDTCSKINLQPTSYSIELNSITSKGTYAPFWLTTNKYGLSSIENKSGYFRVSLKKDITTDTISKWKLGYMADLALPVNYSSNFIIQQLYCDIEHKFGRLTIGAKELPLEMKNEELSCGDMTYSINSRPIPQIRLELKRFWPIPHTKNWISFKGHIAYGWFTDGHWQETFIDSNQKSHHSGSKFHSKSGYVKLGNEKRFPLTLTAGVHFCAQFGGEAWNVGRRADDTSDFNNSHIFLSNNLKSYWHAFFPGGRDASDGAYSNAEGNQLGSYQANITFHNKNWSIKTYAEHFFEDHSQMFFEYDWKDFLIGAEINLPHNNFANTIVVEHINTKDQTGGIYHDHTTTLPIQISGADNYYNHSIYSSWQHWGQAIGNPLLISPIYNNGTLSFYHNRIRATHIGICGNPMKAVHYRLLYTTIKSWGTYQTPLEETESANFFLAECTLKPTKWRNWSLTVGYASNNGTLLGNSNGASFTIKKEGFFNSRNK